MTSSYCQNNIPVRCNDPCLTNGPWQCHNAGIETSTLIFDVGRKRIHIVHDVNDQHD